MKLNKIALLLAMAAAPSLVFAEDAAVTPENNAQTIDYVIGTNQFVQTAFQFTVSANVGLDSTETANVIAVGTYNTKGRNAYTGSSNGGSVTVCGTPTTGATAPEAPTLDVEDPAKGGCGA